MQRECKLCAVVLSFTGALTAHAKRAGDHLTDLDAHAFADGLEAFRDHHFASVALCLIVRDEDVREWVQHHRSIGVGRIYIYDDHSNPPLLGTLMDDINTGLVHYRFTLRKGSAGIQLDTYTQCLRDHGHKHDWMGFLDADEVFTILKHESAVL